LACIRVGFCTCSQRVMPGKEVVAIVGPWVRDAPHLALPHTPCRFELRALRPIARGEEATISYGENKCNAELLRCARGARRGVRGRGLVSGHRSCL
jgi:hypothetical protein